MIKENESFPFRGWRLWLFLILHYWGAERTKTSFVNAAKPRMRILYQRFVEKCRAFGVKVKQVISKHISDLCNDGPCYFVNYGRKKF